jgi:benzoyl-CoA reductase/2-hydroxyglutaryl-CoA dehydratase subunit BcrC/BadD/HgdB
MLLIPHACDSLQGLGSILTDFIHPKQPVLTLYLPRGGRSEDVDFLADELRCLYADLETLTARCPSDSDLMEAIRREETADELLAGLHNRRLKLALTDEAFYRLVRSREYLPAEQFIPLARDVLEWVGEREQDSKPLLLSGIVPEPMDLLTAITELGGTVAADDLACSSRRIYPSGVSDDPFQRMAERILYAPPDPTRGSSISERLDYLLGLARNKKARGVIFYEIKFCEPELFDLPSLREGLQAEGLPSIVIEADISEKLTGRVLTRLEAFMEMIP